MLTNIISILMLLVLFFQDFRMRAIHWSPLIILFFTILAEAFHAQGFSEVAGMVLRNTFFLMIQGIVLVLYYLVKGRSVKSIINVSIGSGDILLFLITTFCFSMVNFVIFYILSLILSLVLWLTVTMLFSPTEKSVPLAGLTSATLVLIFVFDRFSFSFDRFDDSLITSLICRIVI